MVTHLYVLGTSCRFVWHPGHLHSPSLSSFLALYASLVSFVPSKRVQRVSKVNTDLFGGYSSLLPAHSLMHFKWNVVQQHELPLSPDGAQDHVGWAGWMDMKQIGHSSASDEPDERLENAWIKRVVRSASAAGGAGFDSVRRELNAARRERWGLG